MNAPATLTAKVGHDQLPWSGGNASIRPVRISAPATPPAKMAAASLRT
jgi:hypothetical protein